MSNGSRHRSRSQGEGVMAVRKTELVIIGAGPAGICAALEAASWGEDILVIAEKTLGASHQTDPQVLRVAQEVRRHPGVSS